MVVVKRQAVFHLNHIFKSAAVTEIRDAAASAYDTSFEHSGAGESLSVLVLVVHSARC